MWGTRPRLPPENLAPDLYRGSTRGNVSSPVRSRRLNYPRMNPRLEKRTTAGELSFRVVQEYTRKEMLLRSLWSLLVVTLFADRDMRHPIAYLIVGLIVAISVGYQLTRMSRGTDVTLTITQAEIVSTGYTEDKYFPSRRRRREGPDLAWRAKRSEEDGPTYPPGIYCGEDCVLPLVSEEEGASIVMTIYFRFSGTGSDSVGDSHKKPSDLTLLHLDH